MINLSRIPVFVLTGFLGSGKTTLLNTLLKQPGFANTAVVINEFGEIGLDHLLVTSARENIVLLDAGCLCCTVLGSLRETLANLHQQRLQGLVPPFERLIIETSGLADPGPILQLMMRNTLISKFYQMAGLICMVDAVHGPESLQHYPEATEQVALADQILVTKTDLAGGNFSSALFARLKAINPTAEVHSSAKATFSTGFITGGNRQSAMSPWLGGIMPPPETEYLHKGIHNSAVTSECFWIEHGSTWSGLAAWISTIRRQYGTNLLRCKGLIGIQGRPGPVLVHGVKTLFDTCQLSAWPEKDQRSRIIVIGKNLDRATIRSSLSWLLAPEGTQPPFDASIPPPVWTAA
jgi:G3E family GTPase